MNNPLLNKPLRVWTYDNPLTCVVYDIDAEQAPYNDSEYDNPSVRTDDLLLYCDDGWYGVLGKDVFVTKKEAQKAAMMECFANSIAYTLSGLKLLLAVCGKVWF